MISTYTLAVGDKGEERLSVLAELHDYETQELLNRAKGFLDSSYGELRALDIGCGTGSVSQLIASVFGGRCEVLGIDQSADQIAVATRNNSRDNIRFHCKDIMEIGDSSGKFDLVVSRFCLAHNTNPVVVIENAIGLLNDGGILVFEEVNIGSGRSEPEHESFKRAEQLYVSLGRINGQNFGLGAELLGMVKSMHCDILLARKVQPACHMPSTKSIFRLGLGEVGQQYIELGFITPNELRDLENDLKNLENDPNVTIWPAVSTQICAKCSQW